MKICKVILQNKIVFENVKIAESFFDRLLGLSFKKSYKGALLYKNAFWMHSLFMRFKFNALYLDKNYNIIEHHKDVGPWRFLPPVWGSKYVIEYTGIPVELSEKVELVGCQ